jgi:hypothetical protein
MVLFARGLSMTQFVSHPLMRGLLDASRMCVNETHRFMQVNRFPPSFLQVGISLVFVLLLFFDVTGLSYFLGFPLL